YPPKAITPVDGKRRVFGFDYALPLGGKSARGSVVYNQAVGSLAGATAMSGVARRLAVNYSLGALQLRTQVQDIPNTFAGIQSTGFRRNQKSVDFYVNTGRAPFSHGVDSNSILIR